jgi:hypothetical protein
LHVFFLLFFLLMVRFVFLLAVVGSKDSRLISAWSSDQWQRVTSKPSQKTWDILRKVPTVFQCYNLEISHLELHINRRFGRPWRWLLFWRSFGGFHTRTSCDVQDNNPSVTWGHGNSWWPLVASCWFLVVKLFSIHWANLSNLTTREDASKVLYLIRKFHRRI